MKKLIGNIIKMNFLYENMCYPLKKVNKLLLTKQDCISVGFPC